jgi:RNA polymerase sigma factor (sigma-70 family)
MQQSSYRYASLAEDSPLARFYRLHATSLLAYVRQHVQSREDAEDIVVEAFIAALEKEESSLFACSQQEQMAWLRRVAYHKCIDQHRRLVRRPTVAVEALEETLLADERLSPDQVVLRHEQDALLAAGLSQLSEHDQTIVGLRFANGLRCSEISSLLNKSEGAIRVSLSRALNRLRAIYRRQSEEDSHEPG